MNTMTLPRKGLKTRHHNKDMNESGLKKYDNTKYMDMEKGKPAKRPPKPIGAPSLPPNDGFNFDDDIFQTENTSLGKFKIVGI